MEIKTVWILTYTNPANDYQREIFGVYADEDLANDSLNDELLQPQREFYKDEEQLWNEFDPDIKEHKIYF